MCWQTVGRDDAGFRVAFIATAGGKIVERAYYTLADVPGPIMLVACSKCPWQAAFSRADLITDYGAEYPLPNLLDHLAMPDCSKIKNQWDRCGVYYVNAIDWRER